MTPAAQSGAEGCVRLLLTKNPARSFSCQKRGISRLNESRGPGRHLACYHASSFCTDLGIAFLKRWGPLLELQRHWFTCTVMFHMLSFVSRRVSEVNLPRTS